jgi:hypothetical protein
VYDKFLIAPELLRLEMWARDRYAQAYPWAGMSRIPVFFGDSQTQGAGASGVATSVTRVAATSLGLTFGQYINNAVGGITIGNLNVLAPTWVDPIPALLGKEVAVVTYAWHNAMTATTTTGATYLAARKAVPNLKTVWGTSTDTADLTAPQIAMRGTFNAAWDSVMAGAAVPPKTNIDSYMPIHLNSQVGVDGSYAANATAGNDGVHFQDPMQAVLAGIFVAGYNALP